jgi:hypothetical protein
VAEPVEELGEAPLVGVDAAAPLDAFKAELVGFGGDLFGFGETAVIAPQIILIQRFKAFADRDDAGAGGIESDGGDGVAVDAGGAEGVACGGGEGGHLVGVGLGCVIGVFAAAMEGVRGRGGADGALDAVDEGNANAESAEVNAGDDGHGTRLLKSKRFLIRRQEYIIRGRCG